MIRKLATDPHDAADLNAWHGRAVPGPNALAIDGTGGDDRLTGTDEQDSFDLTAGGKDLVDGLGGDDFAYFADTFGRGDRFDGGDGVDYLSLSGTYAPLTITGKMLSGVENIDLASGGRYDLTLSRASMANAANLTIYCLTNTSSQVRIDALAVKTPIAYFASTGNDDVVLGSGNDLFRVRSGGTDIVDGGGGHNWLSLFNISGGVTFDLRTQGAQTVGAGTLTVRNFDDVSGTAGMDTITGSGADNWIQGNGGNDTLTGLGGDDDISVGADFNGVLPTAVLVNGGTGFDTLDISSNAYATGGATITLDSSEFQNSGQGVIKLTGIEALTGTIFTDTLTGDGGDNALFGNNGSDTLSGGDGNDRLYGDSYYAREIIGGFHGPTRIIANDQAAFDDVLVGGAGNDLLNGGAGDDVLIGGDGKDRLTGGLGDDRFAYLSTGDSKGKAQDTISDFAVGDRIDLSAIDADVRTSGDQAFHFGATDGRVGDLVVAYDSVANVTTIRLYVNGDAQMDATINLVGNVALTAADFVF